VGFRLPTWTAIGFKPQSRQSPCFTSFLRLARRIFWTAASCFFVAMAGSVHQKWETLWKIIVAILWKEG